jgi:hypothetical protein
MGKGPLAIGKINKKKYFIIAHCLSPLAYCLLKLFSCFGVAHWRMKV